MIITKTEYWIRYWRGKVWKPAGEGLYRSMSEVEAILKLLQESKTVTDIEVWKLIRRESTWRKH